MNKSSDSPSLRQNRKPTTVVTSFLFPETKATVKSAVIEKVCAELGNYAKTESNFFLLRLLSRFLIRWGVSRSDSAWKRASSFSSSHDTRSEINLASVTTDSGSIPIQINMLTVFGSEIINMKFGIEPASSRETVNFPVKPAKTRKNCSQKCYRCGIYQISTYSLSNPIISTVLLSLLKKFP